jgi:hypothetical protein
MKQQVDLTTSWWNHKLRKCQFYEMSNWRKGMAPKTRPPPNPIIIHQRLFALNNERQTKEHYMKGKEGFVPFNTS